LVPEVPQSFERLVSGREPVLRIGWAIIRPKGFELLEHDPEKWTPVFPRDKRKAFARRSCSNNKIERDRDSKKNYPGLATRNDGTSW
jgi:hypothetical protein